MEEVTSTSTSTGSYISTTANATTPCDCPSCPNVVLGLLLAIALTALAAALVGLYLFYQRIRSYKELLKERESVGVQYPSSAEASKVPKKSIEIKKPGQATPAVKVVELTAINKSEREGPRPSQYFKSANGEAPKPASKKKLYHRFTPSPAQSVQV